MAVHGYYSSIITAMFLCCIFFHLVHSHESYSWLSTCDLCLRAQNQTPVTVVVKETVIIDVKTMIAEYPTETTQCNRSGVKIDYEVKFSHKMTSSFIVQVEIQTEPNNVKVLRKESFQPYVFP
jgi:hypothetical protein